MQEPEVSLSHWDEDDTSAPARLRGKWKVGETGGGRKYGRHTGSEVVARFPGSDDDAERRLQETQLIHFCQAMGMPMANHRQSNMKYHNEDFPLEE